MQFRNSAGTIYDLNDGYLTVTSDARLVWTPIGGKSLTVMACKSPADAATIQQTIADNLDGGSEFTSADVALGNAVKVH